MNLVELDQRVASTFAQAVRRSLRKDDDQLPRALWTLAARAQSMGLLPRDVAGPNGPEAVEAIASAIFSSTAWRRQAPGRLRAEWNLVVDRAYGIVQPGAFRRGRGRRSTRRLAMATSS